MISYEGIQDTLTAILVIIIVSFIIAAAWLSTRVREQPLIATAVVVFQSENNGEGDQTHSDQNHRETQGSSVREGEAAAVRSVSHVKESENVDVTEESEMEVRQRTGGEVANESQNREAYDMSLSQPEELSKNSVQSSDEKDINTFPPDIQPDQAGVSQCLSQDLSSGEGYITSHPNDSSIPSHVSPSEKLGDSLPEMEVRKRRLQQFISMGGTNSCAETHSEQSVFTEPLGVKDIKNSSEDKTTESSDGAHIEEACSHMTETTETFSSSSIVSDPASSVKENKEEERPPGSIKIRLKFLDETQRYVFAQLTEQVGSFKR